MIKLIACDLDETLLNKAKEISDEDVKAISYARQQGVRFVVATGRGYHSLDAILKRLDLYQKENEYIMSGNGAVLCESKDFRKLSFHGISFELANQLFEYGMQQDVCVQVFTDRDVYAFHINEDEKNVLFGFKPDSILCDKEDIQFLKDETIMKVMYQNTNMDYLHQLADGMDFVKEHCSISFSSNRYLEFNAMGIHKGNGLKELCELLQIDIQDTMAIGDNYNDLTMIQAAGIGVCVANAQDIVKESSDYICERDHEHSAVAEAIYRFVKEDEYECTRT